MRKKIESICGIYKITNPIGEIYIGKSKNCRQRRKSNYVRQRKIFDSFQKYGKKNHVFEMIEIYKPELLDKREKFWIKHFETFDTPNGLNLTDGGKKYVFAKESTKIISRNSTGNTNWKGKKHKETTKEKQSLNSGQAKLVLNMETGIYYDSITEASKSTSICFDTLSNKLRGRLKNKTSFRFV